MMINGGKIKGFKNGKLARAFAAKIQAGECDGWGYEAVLACGTTWAIRVYDGAGHFVDYWREAV